MFRLAYNTNGLAHHRPGEALALLASLGYEGVALTPDVGQLDPYRLDPREVRDVAQRAEDLGLALAIETGARYALDPLRKHGPNLCDPSAAARLRRVDHYRRCIDLAVDLGAEVVSLWAGAAPGNVTLDGERSAVSSDLTSRLLDALVGGLDLVAAHAEAAGRVLAFEPEPGMFVERPAGYTIVRDRLAERGRAMRLTLDVGHCVVTGDLPVSSVVRAHAADLVHVHLDDCPRGVHDHRMFGGGDLDLGDTLQGLRAIGFQGLAAVELSRDSHRGPEAAQEALGRLRRALGAPDTVPPLSPPGPPTFS